MSDTFRIIPYVVRSAGTDVPPEEVQAAVNSLAQQTTLALNSVASDPTGPAGGDLSGTYPNPTVAAVHATSGTMSGVAITGGSISATTVNNTPVGNTTPSTVAATSLFASGGAIPAVTTTGTQVYNSPNPTVQFIDSLRSAGNKNAYMTWGSTVLAMGFANDAFTSFTNVFTVTGGFTAGVSGITSTSGTGAWAHTGGFSATGGINSTAVGNTTPSTGAFTTLSASSGLNSTAVGNTTPSTGAFTTLSASSTVSGAGFTSRFSSPGPIGNTAASTGAFTTLSSTGTFTPSSTNGIVGTTTNDNANAGSIGEYVSAGVAQASPVSLTNNTNANVTSISLTAGDWDVEGTTGFVISAGASALLCWVNTVSATQPVLSNGFGFTELSLASTTFGNSIQPIMRTRISVTSTTTVYMSALAQFSSGTVGAWGFMRARRVR